MRSGWTRYKSKFPSDWPMGIWKYKNQMAAGVDLKHGCFYWYIITPGAGVRDYGEEQTFEGAMIAAENRWKQIYGEL